MRANLPSVVLAELTELTGFGYPVRTGDMRSQMTTEVMQVEQPLLEKACNVTGIDAAAWHPCSPRSAACDGGRGRLRGTRTAEQGIV